MYHIFDEILLTRNWILWTGNLITGVFHKSLWKNRKIKPGNPVGPFSQRLFWGKYYVGDRLNFKAVIDSTRVIHKMEKNTKLFNLGKVIFSMQIFSGPFTLQL